MKHIASILLGSLSIATSVFAQPAPQPNIVHILTDDLGWIDPAFAYKAEHGKDSVYETPNLDRLGANGTRFRQAYSPAPTCAPSRAAYMAGQWPAHTGVYHVMGSRLTRAYNAGHSRIDPFYTGRLPLDRPTIPQELKKAGYTSAHIQKWHFGGPGNVRLRRAEHEPGNRHSQKRAFIHGSIPRNRNAGWRFECAIGRCIEHRSSRAGLRGGRDDRRAGTSARSP